MGNEHIKDLIQDKISEVFDELSKKYSIEFDDLSWTDESDLESATDELIFVVNKILENTLKK